MADPLPEMASSCCDKFIVRGDTMAAESSDHTPSTEGSTGDTLDCEHASVAPPDPSDPALPNNRLLYVSRDEKLVRTAHGLEPHLADFRESPPDLRDIARSGR